MTAKKLAKKSRTVVRDEALLSIQHAVVYQCLRDISDAKKRNQYWDDVWEALSDFAPCYHMTRGQMVLSSAKHGFLDFPVEEMERRGVFESQFERDYWKGGCV